MVFNSRNELGFHSFTLITDCSTLLWLIRSRDLDPKLYRWALRLTEFDMEMNSRAGSPHQVSDALSGLL